ncbi:MAG: phenylalanine--tRNA ligase subunit beta, partial [Lachnospiraceae bacterium]|nr:phenylalanine--tRNA ligase subunit beta [Lachnospiraceae bacterium]
ALHLIEELGAGKVTSTHADVNTGNSLEPREMKASVKRVNGVLGVTVPDEAILDILTRLNFNPMLSGDELTIRVPGYREDMATYQDVAEEVIRLYGYDHVKPTFLPTAAVTSGGRTVKQLGELKLKRAMAAAGACEAVHYSFFSPSDLDLICLPEDAPERHAIELINPINADLSLMRTTLAPQMIRAFERNLKRGTLSGKLFEVGKIFLAKDLPLTDYPEERPTLSIGVFGEKADFFEIKSMVESVARELNVRFTYEPAEKPFLHPFRTAKVLVGAKEVGYLGQLRYEVADKADIRVPCFVSELDLGALSAFYGQAEVYTPIPKFDVEKRDFAFVMDASVPGGKVMETIEKACPFVTEVELFDLYEGLQVGLNKKSLAFTVVFTPTDHAFSEAEIVAYVQAVLTAVKDAHGAVLRS